jgi:hypothetical protein
VEELSGVVLDLAGDGQGLRDVEIQGPQAGVLAVFELEAGRLDQPAGHRLPHRLF